SEVPDFYFDSHAAFKAVTEMLGVISLQGFGIEHDHPALPAAGALVYYVSETLCQRPKNIKFLREYKVNRSLILDTATLRNLEIFKSANGSREGSLFNSINRCVTAAGIRLLEQYLATPLIDLNELKRRQQCISELIEEFSSAGSIRKDLQGIRDIVRILSRLQTRIRNPRELGGIRDTLDRLPSIKSQIATIQSPHIQTLSNRIQSLDNLRTLLTSSLKEEVPGDLTEGGYIKDGYDEALDHLRGLTRNNQAWLSELEQSEQQRTGIKNLRIKYNGAFGYFIEITKSYIHLVPENYIRKQTMTNAERYCTEELKQKEKEILHAEEKAIAREEEILRALVATILESEAPLRETALALAELDLFIGWAFLARGWNYTCPQVDDSNVIDIEEGRHPVVEQMLRSNQMGTSSGLSFVPNSTFLSSTDEQIALITGPNMAGKSTYIRQVALIMLMAQIGCWVPAKRCRMGLVDRIFSRIGASDELSRGNSTFMVEMNETANILNNATNRSLIVLDEIGRGTSTYDGLSIAWAVIEYLHGSNGQGPKTLFATHYHELTQLSKTLPRLRNYSVAVKEWNDEIIFVRQVIQGAADRSYGIQVARLAGLPSNVINRAKVILQELESEGVVLQTTLKPPPSPTPKKNLKDNQLLLF
ncbi:MAG: DNA mismatch repair protein MutS, partial [Verrucomicrobia bacterium GWC2_42_7]